MLPRLFAICILSCLASQSVATDQSKPTSEVSGSVIDASGQPAVGATVRAKLIAKKIDQSSVTDEDGRFSLKLPIELRLLPAVHFHFQSSDGQEIAFDRYRPPTIRSDRSIGFKVQLAQKMSGRLRVVDRENQPVAKANVIVQLKSYTTLDRVLTDSEGYLSFNFPASDRVLTVVAWKDGHGLDYELYQVPRDRRADTAAKAPEFPDNGSAVFRLEGAEPLRIQVVDSAGEPIPGVDVYAWLLQKAERLNELNLSFFPDLRAETNQEGRVHFNWFPSWQTFPVTIWPGHQAYQRERQSYRPAEDKGELTIQLTSLVGVSGTVRDPQGNPVGNVAVSAHGDGYGWDRAMDTTTSDKQGRYQLHLSPENIYLLVAGNHDWASQRIQSFVVRAGQAIKNKDITLRQSTRLSGTLRRSIDDKPLPHRRVFVYQYGDALNSLEGVTIENPSESRKWVRPMRTLTAQTDEQGRFEFFLGDGEFDLRPPEQEKVENFTVDGQEDLSIDISTDKAEKVQMSGTVFDDEGQPIAGAKVFGVPQDFSGNDWRAVTDELGKFEVECFAEPTYVHAISSDNRLGSITILDGKTTQPELILLPTGSVSGRLIRPDSDDAWGEQPIHYGVDVPDLNNRTWSTRFGDRIRTDAEGRFHLKPLVAGHEYSSNFGQTPEGIFHSFTKFKIEPGQELDLGDIKAKPAPKRYVPPTLEQRIERRFAVEGTPMERFEKARQRIALVKQHLLILFGSPSDPRCRDLLKLRYEDSDYRKVRDQFLIMAIPTGDDELTAAQELANSLAVDLDEQAAAFTIAVLDNEGTLVTTASDPELVVDGELSKDRLLKWLRDLIPEQLVAKDLLEAALKQAAQKNKRVIVQETATWCGPCLMLSRFLQEHPVWQEDYVLVKMDHRYQGARELMLKIRDGANGGIPWYAILDDQGDKLATSNRPAKDEDDTRTNIGFPSSDEGIAHFKNMLMTTRQRLTDEQIDQLVGELADQ